MPEKDHIQAAMLCLEQTQTGSWNSGRKTDMAGVRDEYGANDGRFVDVYNYMTLNIRACRDKEKPATRHKQLFRQRRFYDRGEESLLSANVSSA